ncbi:MAG: hypothetical protein FD167_1080, partial [bacterium]
LLSIPTNILFFIWLYKTWEAVPQQHQSTSPGKALGFLFVPFFNLYWIFRAFPGLSKSIQNANQAVNPSHGGSVAVVVGIIACVMSLIPFIQIGAFIPFLIWVLLTNSQKNKMLRTYQGQNNYR